MTKLIGEIIWWVLENWRKLIGYPIIGIGLIALAFVFPWILIVYCLGIGMHLISDR